MSDERTEAALTRETVVHKPEPEPFATRVRRLREDRNLTPTQLAFVCGVTEGAMRQIERGQTKRASLDVGIRMAAVLGVEPRYLAFGDGDGTQEPAVKAKPWVVAVPHGRIDEVETQVTAIRSRLDSLERRLERVERERRM